MIEVQIILIIPERILNLFTGYEETEEDETGENSGGDGDPAQRSKGLKGRATQ